MVIPKAIIVHNYIEFQAWAESNVNFLYHERPPLKKKTIWLPVDVSKLVLDEWQTV